nr:ORFIII-like polyprotein [Tanacetum cinerariifolium]
MLKICEDNGLVLSPTKMKITVSTIDFLGAVIGEGTIKLQPRIIKKIVNFKEEELKTKKGLRSFLRILNYARNHIPKLGILLRPLYEETNAHGDKRLKSSDYQLVRKIKEQVQNLPDLEIPPKNAYIILETDGCMEGWGGIIKEKMFEFKTRKPEESSSNWKPWHKDWDATTSNFLEDDASNDDNKYRYNRKGFLEDDDARSDDLIFIVDQG